MGWSKKASFKDLVLFCNDWKSRNDIKRHFKLTAVESWHCFRWLKKLSHDFEYRMNVGHTARSHHVRSRKHIRDKYKE
mgnify:CR=1 FL=1